MLKIRSIYYRLLIRRGMDDEERANFEGEIVDMINCLQDKENELSALKDKPILSAIDSLKRIADTLERLLKISEMGP